MCGCVLYNLTRVLLFSAQLFLEFIKLEWVFCELNVYFANTNSIWLARIVYTGLLLTLALLPYRILLRFIFIRETFANNRYSFSFSYIRFFIYFFPFFPFSFFTFPSQSFHISFIWLTACTRPIKGIPNDKYNTFYVSLIIIVSLLHDYIILFAIPIRIKSTVSCI